MNINGVTSQNKALVCMLLSPVTLLLLFVRFGIKTNELQDDMFSGQIAIISRGTVQQLSKKNRGHTKRDIAKKRHVIFSCQSC